MEGPIGDRQSRARLGRLVVALVVLVSSSAAAPHLGSQPQAPPLAIRGGTLIDVRTGGLTRDSTIVIRDGRIEQVGTGRAVSIPDGAQVVDAQGQYVLPGLWDSHVHTRDFDGILNITYGVTSTMDMGNILDWIHAVAESREKQLSFGPRIFAHGMSIGGSLGPHQWNAKNPDEARWAARKNIEAGASFLKAYGHATPDMIRAIVEEANKAGLNVTADLSRTDAREAILAGLNGLAHGTGIGTATMPPDLAAKLKRGELDRHVYTASNYLQDPAMFDNLIRLMVERDVRLEPNIVQVYRCVYDQWDRYQLEYHRLAMHPVLYSQIKEMFVRMWATDFPRGRACPPGPDLAPKLRKALANHQLFARKFSAAGGKLLVGSDNYYHVPAGMGVWQEMELLADAGIAPLAILQGATINPAEYVKQDKRLGTVEAGKLADIIILRENPLEDISNIRTLEAVIQHGKIQPLGYTREYRIPIPRPYQRVNNELPRPYIFSVQPSGVPMGTEKVVLTIKGRDFDRRNRVLWGDDDLKVLEVSSTEIRAEVPAELLRRPGTYKLHMITGGRVFHPSLNFAEVMVTFGRTFNERWNGQTMSIEF